MNAHAPKATPTVVDGAAGSDRRPQLVDGPYPAQRSPARDLQTNLSTWAARTKPRWSARKRLAFILATCGGFWILCGVALHAALR